MKQEMTEYIGEQWKYGDGVEEDAHVKDWKRIRMEEIDAIYSGEMLTDIERQKIFTTSNFQTLAQKTLTAKIERRIGFK